MSERVDLVKAACIHWTAAGYGGDALADLDRERADHAKEVADLKKEVAIMKSITWCAYCGVEFPLDSVTADQIGEHIAVCTRHPLFALRLKNENLQKKISDLRKRISELEAQLQDEQKGD